MANKKVSQLTSKPAVNLTDLFLIADPTSGQAFKTTISDLGTAIGSGVSSVNTLVGAVVLDTDDIQELASPTNRWFTDTRARAALSASSPLAYNSGTGVFSIAQANGSTNGFLSSTDWTTFNAKQAALSGTGFVKISGTIISYDNSTYLTTSAAASTYLALSGGTLTGALNGTSATFTGDLTLSATNPRLYFTDTDNNPDYFISNTDGTFTIYDVTNSQSRFTIGTTGNGTFGGNLTVGQIIRSGGTSAQFLKADGSVDSSTYLTTGTAASTYLALAGGTLTGAVTGTRLSLSQNSADITLSISNAGTGRAFSVLGTSYFSTDIQLGYATNAILKTTALGFITSAIAGTDYQAPLSGTGFVKISGSTISYDNSTYLTTASASSTYLTIATASSTYLPLAGGTLTGALSGTSALFSSSVRANNPSEGATGEGLIAGQSFKIDGTGTSQKAVMYMVSNVLSDTYASGLTAQFGNFAGDKGFGFNLNTSGGYELYVKNTTWNKALTIANTGAATFSSSVTAGGFIKTETYFNAGSGSAKLVGVGSAISGGFSSTDMVVYNTGGDLYLIGTGAAGMIVKATTANVGINTTSPAAQLDIQAVRTANLTLLKLGTNNASSANGDKVNIDFYSDGNNYLNGRISREIEAFSTYAGALTFATGASGSVTERMRITSGGSVLVGTQTSTGLATGSSVNVGILIGTGAVNSQVNNNSNIYLSKATGFTSGDLTAHFVNGSYVGGISTNGSTTTYAVASDYRLKEDLKAIKGLEILNKINVYDYKWKSSDERMDGVIAHELQEVLPYAVTGLKDGERMQAVDYSKIVPVMVQAIKELKAELDTLKNK